MLTYYSQNGFTIEIVRFVPSGFSGTVLKDRNNFENFSNIDNFIYLTELGTYTFSFQSGELGDPINFILKDYDTGIVIADVAEEVFRLGIELILETGFDGETSKDLTISYPLQTFTYTNSLGRQILWICSPLENGCDSLESTINDLPEPKIIGNLTECSGEDYKGNVLLDPSCNATGSSETFLFKIIDKLTNVLLYSRVECCCPVVNPATNPPPGFVCTCPDWGKATSYNQTLFSASIGLRQWVLSNAGSKADCKHIMAAKRIMNIEQPIYTDPPYSAPPAPLTPG